eukprot:TRINITY_DN1641_c0_g1_i1.p2 TRINITY_DN1641_c0_g1~~TRINITY_DN1641_c0_g1_i1.p2  ORF type:complete len:164 (+),score=66.93 TRINITY_DN1641_c0_g1_i1:93-584(+)
MASAAAFPQGGLLAVVLLLAGAACEAQAEGMAAWQKSYYLSKSDPEAANRYEEPACSAESNAKAKSSLQLRLGYLEELAAKQDKKLAKLRMQLTGEDGSKDPALAAAGEAEDSLVSAQMKALEQRRERREVILQELLKAADAAIAEASSEVSSPQQQAEECRC